MHTVVFDLEIATPIEELPGGWNDARQGEAGVACVCLWDSNTERFHVYDSHSIEKCIEHLNSAELIVSFNGRNFDVPALEGFSGLEIYAEHYDILDEIWKAAGKKVKGYRLGEVAPRTIGLGKDDLGAGAPILYRQGRHGELIDYCINDVHITKELFEFIREHGYVISPDPDTALFLEQPKAA